MHFVRDQRSAGWRTPSLGAQALWLHCLDEHGGHIYSCRTSITRPTPMPMPMNCGRHHTGLSTRINTHVCFFLALLFPGITEDLVNSTQERHLQQDHCRRCHLLISMLVAVIWVSLPTATSNGQSLYVSWLTCAMCVRAGPLGVRSDMFMSCLLFHTCVWRVQVSLWGARQCALHFATCTRGLLRAWLVLTPCGRMALCVTMSLLFVCSHRGAVSRTVLWLQILLVGDHNPALASTCGRFSCFASFSD